MEKTLFDEQRYRRVDLLASWWPYTEGLLRITIETLMSDAVQASWGETQEQKLRSCAEASWSLRHATKRFSDAHPDIVWRVLVPLCLPATQVLLLRLADREETQDIAKLLRAPMADYALHDQERAEIELLLPQVCVRLWNDYRREMGKDLADVQAEQSRAKALMREGDAQGSVAWYERAMAEGSELSR